MQAAKIQRLAEGMQPTLEEQNQFREELARELKENPVRKQKEQLERLEAKHASRQKYIEKKIRETVAIGAKAHEEFAA